MRVPAVRVRQSARRACLAPTASAVSKIEDRRSKIEKLLHFRSSIFDPRVPRARGFTLVELFVVIAIISLLVALLLPAVQQARDAARRASCRNNLMQIGLALQNYEMAHERLPPGSVNPTGPIRSESKGYHMGWMVQILPQLDQANSYANFNFSVSVYDPVNVPAVSTPSRVFYCPSAAGGSYAGCHHDVESPIDSDNHGVLFLNSDIRYRDIRDGLSTTIFVGEHGGDWLGWASGTRATLRNMGGPINGGRIAPGTMTQPPVSGPGLEIYVLAVGGFSSSHTGGAYFLLGDGSVRLISESTSLNILQSLAHRADGNLPGEF